MTVVQLQRNTATQAVATSNWRAIQDAIDALNYGGVIEIAANAVDVTDMAYLWDMPVLNPNVTLIGQGKNATRLGMMPGTNRPAIIANRAWVYGGGLPASVGRGNAVRDISLDGNFLNRTTGALQQASGLGHGIAFAGYDCEISHVVVGQTRGHGIFFDTATKDGVLLGEGIENRVQNCATIRTGLSGIHFDDTGNANGGTTDGFIETNTIQHCNVRNSTSGEEGHGIFCKSAGGHLIRGNHVYGASDFGAGNYQGYGTGASVHTVPGGSRIRDGIKCLSASGTRVVENQVADFGYVTPSGAPVTLVYGINVQGKSDRGFTLSLNTIWTDEDANVLHGSKNQYWAVRITGTSEGFGACSVIGNIAEPRDGRNLNGFKVDHAGSGWIGSLTGNTIVTDLGIPYQAATGKTAGLRLAANSWQ